MLKALELVGFKSFADKTRFEFPHGITVVVGPNGSGKSNIVDAIKWVLGEQSVKSLRGKEMADVIFNGSGTRRGLNSAEISLTLENTNRVLDIDTTEVHITRRVYRSGEGEYLINRQPSRLRDIRDLLSGTGMGTQAYSVIEQGKVDVLLQASARDRRAIFEEAAGISRFKSKKIEAERRLERVDQNLLRLSDIVDEVESQLRSVRMQAGKARRFRQYTSRLQELRTQVGLADWTKKSEKLADLETQIEALSVQRDSLLAEAESQEAQVLEAEQQIDQVNESIRQSESQMSANREMIAGQESAISHERGRCQDLEEEITHHRQQLVAMGARAGDLQDQLRQTAEEVERAVQQHHQIARLVAEGERDLSDLIASLDQLRNENEQRRIGYMDRLRDSATLSNEIGALEGQVEAAQATHDRNRRQKIELDQQAQVLEDERNELASIQEDLSQQLDQRHNALEAAKKTLAQTREQLEHRENERIQLNQQLTGMTERANLLEELLRRHEGLSPGVRDVLARAQEAIDGPFQQVRGLVADLIQVTVEASMLIEVALGESTQHVVVTQGDSLVNYLATVPNRFSGRVGFVWLNSNDNDPSVYDPNLYDPNANPEVNLDGRPGILGRADRYVSTDPEYASLFERLLGRTWIVETLEQALAFDRAEVRGCRFVTLTGELLDTDGTLCVGPRHAATGLISRRSELRTLRKTLVESEAQIDALHETIETLRQQIREEEQSTNARKTEHARVADLLAEHRHKIVAAVERQTQWDRQYSVLEAEYRVATTQRDEAQQTLSETQQRHQQMQVSLAEMETGLQHLRKEIERLDADHQARNHKTTDTKVELAKSEERLENLRARMRQFEESREERQRALKEYREQLAQSTKRADQSKWTILKAESEIAELYLRKEAIAQQTVQRIETRETLQTERTEQANRAQRARSKNRKIEETIHTLDLEANAVRLERNALANRLREDYGIELAELEQEPTAEEQHQREEVVEEINDLRKKINNLGNINLEALEELDQLEQRHTSLSDQYHDLTNAKNSLQRIIEKINIDSRRLFAETLEMVRGHFKTLFADLFGGGQADIIMDEDADILETGIEIVARPPGKELRNISLLSGGEKTLTCVALLLAIFRSRPSPFCVLDEVDAALDEANIDRFTKVLQDFLAWTQFIIVTHSKKTMTCANTIYGVTMQESGISKQVSVRFDDVSETGEILIPTDRDPQPPPSSPTTDDDETQAA